MGIYCLVGISCPFLHLHTTTLLYHNQAIIWIFLDKKKNNESTEYEISVRTSDLELYKTTLSDVINSILDDEELLKLYSENSKEDISKDATVKQ